MSPNPRVIAIDGPAGSGKSTMARLLAAHIGWRFMETGAIYRALGVFCRERGVDPSERAAVVALIEDFDIDIQVDPADGRSHVHVRGQDMTGRCYTPEAAQDASRIASDGEVRARLVDFQRSAAYRADGVVMEGRDIGTVIVPEAPLKVFLTATPEERARRRHRDLVGADHEIPFEQVLAEVIERDRRDEGRAAAPLKPAEDAVHLVTDGMDIPTVLEHISRLASERDLI
jgi:CMP/dCMP kinase